MSAPVTRIIVYGLEFYPHCCRSWSLTSPDGEKAVHHQSAFIERTAVSPRDPQGGLSVSFAARSLARIGAYDGLL